MTPDEKDAMIRTIADPGAGGTHGREAAKARLEVALATEVWSFIRSQPGAIVNCPGAVW